MNRYGKWLGALFLAVFLSSCILRSLHPLGPWSSAIADPQLMGLWSAEGPREKSGWWEERYLSVLPMADGRIKMLMFDNREGFALEFRGYIVDWAGMNYFNMHMVQNGRIGEDFVLGAYEILSDGELVIYPFKEDFFRRAIANGKIKGVSEKVTLESGKTAEGDVRLSASTGDLQAFVSSCKGREHLDKPLRYKKIKKQ